MTTAISRPARGIVTAIALSCVLLAVTNALAARVVGASDQSEYPPSHLSASAASTSGETYTLYVPVVLNRHDEYSGIPFGIQVYGQDELSRQTARFSYVAEAGAQWMRWPIEWYTIEPVKTSPRTYNWTYWDQAISDAVSKDIRLILTIGGQPSWAAAYQMGPVTNTVDLLDFVRALVERYDADGVADAPGSPDIGHFELYNEPDNAWPGGAANGGYGLWGHNGAAYAALLRQVYPVVKQANPHAKLVLGGLALDGFEELNQGPFDSGFLDDVLAACRGYQCFDVMNFHYFPFYRSYWDPYGPDIIGKTNYVRQRLEAHGFGRLPIFVTEMSWGSGGDWGSPQLQNRYVVKGYVRGLAADLSVVSWYYLEDTGDAGLPGLLSVSLEPKESFLVYQHMATEMLDGVAFRRALTPAETGSSQLVGYVFWHSGRRLDVVWTEDGTRFNPDDDPTIFYTVQASSLRVVDMFGNEEWHADADDGVVDGRIRVVVNGAPLYLEYY
ncbi:MAG: hypothetical protein GX620_07595 [Chloroflexi bacterium]|nr:hypothetical protein [Chloroflexota bacterium]